MKTRFCPECGTKVQVPADYQASAGRCPSCGATIDLTGAGAGAPPRPAAPASRPAPAREGGQRRRPSSMREPEPRPVRGGSRRGGRRPARDDYDDYDDYEDRGRRRPARRGGRRGGGSSEGTTVFVLGLLGLLLCAILAPIAWVKGRAEIDRCRRNRVSPDGLLTAGTTLGAIGTILMVVWVLLIIFVVFTAALAGPG